jgi:tetratricopeptide (TPR) repeat protein
MIRRNLRYCLLLLACLALASCNLARKDQAAVPSAAGQEPAGAVSEAVPPEENLPDVELSPDLLYGLLLGEIAGQRGNLSLSIEQYLQAARQTRDPRIAARATRIAVYARDSVNALAAAKIWVEVSPDSLDARQMLALLQVRNGDLDEAVANFEQVLAATPMAEDKKYMLIAGLLTREPDKERALKVMKQLVAKSKDNAHALFAYGFLAEQAGELVIARTAMENALALKPNWDRALVQYAQILRLQRETARALAVLKQGLRKHPKNLQLRLTYARLLVESRRLPEARKQFETLAELSPDNPDILYALGVLALQTEDLEAAKGYLLQLAKSGHRSLEASFYLGQIAETQGQYDEALRWYEIIDSGSNFLDAQIRIAVVLTEQGKLAAARNHLHSVEVRGEKQNVRLILAESELLQDKEMYQATMTVLGEGLERYPDNVDLLYARSLLAERMNNLALAEQDLRRVLKQDPDNAHALNALGYTLADRTSRYDEAYKLVKRALELRPDDAAILDSMGWVMYRLGRHDDAVRYLQKALQLHDDGEIAAHLGEVLWVMGRTAEAKKVWQRAIKSFPGHKVLQEVMQRFQQ